VLSREVIRSHDHLGLMAEIMRGVHLKTSAAAELHTDMSETLKDIDTSVATLNQFKNVTYPAMDTFLKNKLYLNPLNL